VKVPVSRTFFVEVQNSNYASVAAYLEESDQPAELLENTLRGAMEKEDERPILSEINVHNEAETLIDSTYEVVCDDYAWRDKSSGSTAGGPDSSQSMNSHQVSFAEYKTASIEAARQDCVRKTPFDAWGEVFGSLPFVFAYAMSGKGNDVVVDFGVLQHGMPGKWTSLSRDIYLRAQRADVLIWVLRIIPFLRATGNYLASAAHKSLSWRLERKAHGLFTGRSLSLYVMEKKICVRKCWTFRDAAAAKQFGNRLQGTYQQLRRSDLVAHLADNTMIGPTSDNDTVVRGYFVPHGFPLIEMHLAEDACHNLAEQLLRLLRFLRERRVIHHDLRPENIICTTRAFQQNSRFLAIDFDDAVIVPDEDDTVSGCSGFDYSSHAPNITQRHSFEVDVWGVGFILHQKAPSLGQLGPETCRDYETLDLDELQRRIDSTASPRSRRARQRAEP